MTRRYERAVDAPPELVWALLARPALWSTWAPHARGAWGLGEPEVRLGARGAARLLGLLPVPAQVVAKAPGRSWTWRVGQVTIEHRVGALERGSLVVFELSAPGPLEAALHVTYGPLLGLLAGNVARVAQLAHTEAWRFTDLDH